MTIDEVRTVDAVASELAQLEGQCSQARAIAALAAAVIDLEDMMRGVTVDELRDPRRAPWAGLVAPSLLRLAARAARAHAVLSGSAPADPVALVRTARHELACDPVPRFIERCEVALTEESIARWQHELRQRAYGAFLAAAAEGAVQNDMAKRHAAAVFLAAIAMHVALTREFPPVPPLVREAAERPALLAAPGARARRRVLGRRPR
jgi:hypothetical protein